MIRRILILAAASLLSVPAVFAQEKSLLEREPAGWTNLMPGADLKGWSHLPIPPTLGVDPRPQWSVDTAPAR